jgi:hypothetical protein
MSSEENALKFLLCFTKYVSTFPLLEPICPVSRVNITININKNSFPIPLSIPPLAIIRTNFKVSLLSKTTFKIMSPLSLVSILLLVGTFNHRFVNTIAMTHLKIELNRITYPIEELTFISVTIRIVCCSYSFKIL